MAIYTENNPFVTGGHWLTRGTTQENGPIFTGKHEPVIDLTTGDPTGKTIYNSFGTVGAMFFPWRRESAGVWVNLEMLEK